MISWNAKSTVQLVLYFLLTTTRSGRLLQYFTRSLPKNLGWGKIVIICIQVFVIFYLFFFFAAFFGCYFFIHTDDILQRRWSVLQRAIFCISYWLGILSMSLSLLFLMISSAPTITGTVVVLRFYIFSISVSRSLYLLILLYSLTDMLLSISTDISIKRHIFLFIVLNYYIWSIVLYFSISLDCKVPENSSFFGFCYWFWLVFIPSFTI